MPLFIFISGYFAKRASVKKALNFLLLYLIFQPIFRGFYYVLYPNSPFKLNLDVPYFHLWYLVSMAGWYFFAVGVRKLQLSDRIKIILSGAFFAFGIASKYLSGPIVTIVDHIDPKFYSYTLSYQRTLSFLPFFLAGLILTEDNMKKLQNTIKLKKLTPILGIVSVYTYFILADHTNLEKVLKGSYGIEELKGTISHISLQIIIGYLVAIAMSFLLLNLIGNKKSFLTRLGDHSLPIYLFHAFFVMIVKKISLFKEIPPVILLSILFLISMSIVWLLSSRIIIQSTYYLWHPSEVLKVSVKKLKTT